VVDIRRELRGRPVGAAIARWHQYGDDAAGGCTWINDRLDAGNAWAANMEGVAAGEIGRVELVALLTREMPNQDPVTVEP
jgi:hypothetical protein